MTSTNDTVFVQLSPAELYLYKKDMLSKDAQKVVEKFLADHPDGKIFLTDAYGNIIKYDQRTRL